MERFIDGPYRKHNNNFGYVSEEERNTPQAFSHFTYESSGHQLLCVDIQGVSDMYTVSSASWGVSRSVWPLPFAWSALAVCAWS